VASDHFDSPNFRSMKASIAVAGTSRILPMEIDANSPV
jgi:hypothetical protein